jgi:hypothetical protein
MSKLDFKHSHTRENIVNGKRVLEKEMVMDGNAKGLSFSFLMKTDSDFMKVYAREVSKDQFEYTVQKGEDKKTDNVDLKKLTELVKKNKKLDFVTSYLKKRKGSRLSRSMSRSKSKSSKRKSSKRKSSKRKSSKRKSSKRKSSKRK